ncbi:MAG: molybdopterin converting factor subunit 1 [Anaerolineaceae bacterium]
MEITVLLFASVAERAGTRRFTLSLDEPATVASARDAILAQYPSIAPFVPNLMYALDEEYAREQDTVTPHSTLALIPPVSGG